MRSLLFSAVFLTCLFGAETASAQDLDFDFSPEETTGGNDDDGGELTFEAIDTAKEVADVEKARKAEIDLIRVIQRRPFLRRKRVELAPMLGTNVNDALVSIFVAGGALNYHLSEVMSIGLSGSYSLGSETDLFDRVIEDYELFPEISKVRWSASLDFQYAFMYGKFALFNTWIIPWDTYGVLGAGVTQTELAVHPSLSMGVGQRYFMNRWFTLNVEVKDNVYNEDYPGGSSIVNNIMFTTGVSFFIPPNFEYRMLK